MRKGGEKQQPRKKWLKRNLEKDSCDAALPTPGTQGPACVSFGAGLPSRRHSQPKAIWGWGRSKGNDRKGHPLAEKPRWHLLATPKRNRSQGRWELLLEVGPELEYLSPTCPLLPSENKSLGLDGMKSSRSLLTGQEALCCPYLGPYW